MEPDELCMSFVMQLKSHSNILLEIMKGTHNTTGMAPTGVHNNKDAIL